MGKVALLDLSEGEVRDYPWSDEDRRQYIGGKAMAEKLLADVLKGKTDALSPESPIVIATGPLTGTGAPCSNHFFVAALSPLGGRYQRFRLRRRLRTVPEKGGLRCAGNQGQVRKSHLDRDKKRQAVV